jgi:pimeloyl-ACP methyl ester carboxylesterase
MGDRDVFVTERDLSELRRIVPSARTTVTADCGHFGNVERPRAVLAALFG